MDEVEAACGKGSAQGEFCHPADGLERGRGMVCCGGRRGDDLYSGKALMQGGVMVKGWAGIVLVANAICFLKISTKFFLLLSLGSTSSLLVALRLLPPLLLLRLALSSCPLSLAYIFKSMISVGHSMASAEIGYSKCLASGPPKLFSTHCTAYQEYVICSTKSRKFASQPTASWIIHSSHSSLSEAASTDHKYVGRSCTTTFFLSIPLHIF